MINRRTFLKSSGIITLSGVLPVWGREIDNFPALKYPPIGLQVYTLSSIINAPGADTRTVLKQIADMGIRELETATGANGLYYRHSARDFGKTNE